ncbi:MAG: metallophosphoesterase [Desulfuromonadales bacterium]|nr:MAG: metallophosphoesterase [Desulfuromonadales bacterium]
MKVLVLSDTHGNHSLAVRALDMAGHTDHIVHLGDEIEDACFLEEVTGISVTKVLGNCDLSPLFPRETTLELDGKRVLLTHGDLYTVKTGLDKLKKKAVAERIDVVLYGHTHIPIVQKIDNILFVNPGCLKKGCIEPSFALLSIDNGVASANIVPLTCAAI